MIRSCIEKFLGVVLLKKEFCKIGASGVETEFGFTCG